MLIKTTIVAVATLCSIAVLPSFKPISARRPFFSFQDSLPALHTIEGNDIVSVDPSFEAQTLALVLKNQHSYIYHHKDWDMEDSYPATDKKIAKAIRSMERTYTKTEQAPAFPGGEEGWNKYIRDFCTRNQKLIRKKGPATVTVQFVVHLKGQVTEIRVVSNPDDPKLSDLAVQAIKEGPLWIPAMQNGREVVCYQIQPIILGL